MDFIAEEPDEKLYIQVTETMSGEATRGRELRPLRLINDNYEKIVLSMDKSFIKSYEGIKAVNIIDFLLEEQKIRKLYILKDKPSLHFGVAVFLYKKQNKEALKMSLATSNHMEQLKLNQLDKLEAISYFN